MALDADSLVDRRRLKRQLGLWRWLAIVIAVALVAVAVGRFTGIRNQDHISRLIVGNVILDDLRRHEALKRIAEDASVKALIIRIDSPGGTVVGGEALYQSLRNIAETRPVVAVLGQVATSAGYMVALAADHIVAREGTITGSIGVILQTTEITGLLDKLGISTEAIKSGPLKAAPSPLERMTPDVRKAAQVLVDDIFQMFISMVAERRNLARAEVEKLADGRVFTGRMARDNGLVDTIGGEAEALRWLKVERGIDSALPVRDVKVRRGVADWLENLESLVRKTTFSERLTLDGLISLWHPDLR